MWPKIQRDQNTLTQLKVDNLILGKDDSKRLQGSIFQWLLNIPSTQLVEHCFLVSPRAIVRKCVILIMF